MKKQPPFYQTGIPKNISTPQPQSGTASFPTTESRESKYTLKQLGGMVGDVAMSMLPVGRIKSAISAGKALSKVPSYLSKLNKKFPTGSQMKKHYDDVNKGIKQIKK